MTTPTPRYLTQEELDELRDVASPVLTKPVQLRSCDLSRLLQEVADRRAESLGRDAKLREAEKELERLREQLAAKPTLEAPPIRDRLVQVPGGPSLISYRGSAGAGAIHVRLGEEPSEY